MTRDFNNAGMKINLDGDSDTQIAILCKHMVQLLAPEISNDCEGILYDRCILDGAVYTNVLNKIGKVRDSANQIANMMLFRYLDYYDHIFYIPREFDLVEDGQRSVDETFSTKVIEQFEQYIDPSKRWVFRDNYLTSKVTTVTGTVEERVNTILENI